MPVRFVSLLRQDGCPGFLRVVQNERHKLHQRLFRLIAWGRAARPIRIAYRGRSRADGPAAAKKCEKIRFKYKAEDQQDDRAANADVHPAKLKSAATALG